MQPNTWASTSNSYTGLDFLIAETISQNDGLDLVFFPLYPLSPTKERTIRIG